MESNKILSADLLDILFEHRNKSYGAYELRRSYNKRINRAMIITGSVLLLAISGSVLASSKRSNNERVMVSSEMTIQELKPEEKKIIPPPQAKKPEVPQVETRAFTDPIITEEPEKPVPPQESLSESKIDIADKEGIPDDGAVDMPKAPDEGKGIIEQKKEMEPEIWEGPVEIEAKFPGGEAKWRQYLERNCNGEVAADNNAPAGTYQTVVQFIVDKEGNISDVKALTSHGYGMEEEAVRVIKKGPRWEPAIQNGRKVKAYRKQPITFRVEGE